MDNGLVQAWLLRNSAIRCCLNPCCSGQWSSTLSVKLSEVTTGNSLNPCCSGQWSSTLVENTEFAVKLS